MAYVRWRDKEGKFHNSPLMIRPKAQRLAQKLRGELGTYADIKILSRRG